MSTSVSPTNDIEVDPSWFEETDLIFLGTGSSGGTPKLTCLTGKGAAKRCPTCFDALLPGSPNNRRNTSAVIRTQWFASESERVLKKDRFILIDCGKSFMQAAIAHFPAHGIRRVDAVLLTHSHADACFGMDDLRSLCTVLPEGQPLPVYLRQADMDVMRGPFGYLMPQADHGRYVAKLDWRVFDPALPLTIFGLPIVPLEVEHGAGYTSLGYAFGDVVYISDLNRIYEHTRDILRQRYKHGSLPKNATEDETLEWQQDKRRQMGTLIIDALYPEEPYPSHYSLLQAVDEAKIWRPRQTFTVGMAHQLNHHADNEKLKKLVETDNLSMALAYDGQVLRMQL